MEFKTKNIQFLNESRRTMKKDSYHNALTFIYLVLFTGYLIGTMTHVLHLIDVIKLGFYNSAKAYGVSPLNNAYWLSLTIIDPVIAILLLKKNKIGAILAFLNVLINVIVNSSLVISKLAVISFSTVYGSLGNIYNGLQIALLLFSLLSLPVIMSKKGRYIDIFGVIPILLLVTGLGIHLFGLSKLIFHIDSLWVLWVHTSMIVIDGGLCYLLFKRVKLGYVLAVVLLSIFGLLQAGFAVAIFFGIQCSFNLAMAVTIALCCLGVASLVLNRERYIS